jgi:hypothetical protein
MDGGQVGYLQSCLSSSILVLCQEEEAARNPFDRLSLVRTALCLGNLDPIFVRKVVRPEPWLAPYDRALDHDETNWKIVGRCMWTAQTYSSSRIGRRCNCVSSWDLKIVHPEEVLFVQGQTEMENEDDQ